MAFVLCVNETEINFFFCGDNNEEIRSAFKRIGQERSENPFREDLQRGGGEGVRGIKKSKISFSLEKAHTKIIAFQPRNEARPRK